MMRKMLTLIPSVLLTQSSGAAVKAGCAEGSVADCGSGDGGYYGF